MSSSMSAMSSAFAGALVALAAHGRIGYGTGFAFVYLSMAALGVLAISRAPRLRASDSAGQPAGGQLSGAPAPAGRSPVKPGLGS